MTKSALLADIHGGWPALDSVPEDLRQFKPDRVIVVGDLINLGHFRDNWREQFYPDELLGTEMLYEYLECAVWEEYAHPAYQVGKNRSPSPEASITHSVSMNPARLEDTTIPRGLG